MFFFVILILLISAAFIDRWLLTKANNKIWQSTVIEKLAKVLPFAFVLFAPLWGLGTWQQIPWIRLIGATGTSISFVLNFVMLLFLPTVFLIYFIGSIFRKAKSSSTQSVDNSRRLFLKTAAAAMPAVAVAGVGNGLSLHFPKHDFLKYRWNILTFLLH